MNPSLYIHIPFCKQKCPYCDFYSIVCYDGLASDYIEALVKQIREIDAEISSIYIGGGTPTVLSRESLGRLLKNLKRFVNPGIEFTIEANPESLNREILKLFLDSGINRLSLGVQSFNDDKLKKLGRIHSAQAAYEAINLVREAGFKNTSIDLIFGVWDEGLDDWKQELKKAVSLPIKHISCYGLTYEKDTALFEMAEELAIAPLEDDAAAQMYKVAIDFLRKEGFRQYEVSNFAKEGYPCRHNQNYWENNSYIGLGASAVSYVDGVRKENISDAGEYIARHKRGEGLGVFQEKLSPIEKARETAAVKIRTREGIDLNWFKQKTGFDFLELEAEPLKNLVESGLVSCEQRDREIHRAHLNRKGFLFCDKVSSEFL